MALEDKLHAVIEASRLEAGIAISQIESGTRIEINGDLSFPMASVFKIPILATAGQQIAEGKLNLDTRITLNAEDKSAGSGILPFFDAGLNPTVRDLLTLMIIISDNTATDMVVDLLGGTACVESFMHSLGLTDIHFKMNCKQLLKNLFPPEIRDLSLAEIQAWDAENDILRDSVVFKRNSENNVSTASAMTTLVQKLHQGEIVTGAVQEELLGIMLKQQLNNRLPRFMPPNIPFAHKTGTIAGVCNDSGVMTISDNNHVVITVFTWWDDAEVRHKPDVSFSRIFEVESAIGSIARLAYEHFKE